MEKAVILPPGASTGQGAAHLVSMLPVRNCDRTCAAALYTVGGRNNETAPGIQTLGTLNRRDWAGNWQKNQA